MLRKLALTAVILGATLVAAPTVLGSVGGQRLGAAPFAERRVATRGWESGPLVGARRLKIGASVGESLTIANDGGVRARYLLSARVTGDRGFAAHLRYVITRRADHARVFAGPATRLQSVDLGAFAPASRAEFDVSVTLVPTGSTAGDDALQARWASVDLGWTATQA